jgi:hypothetical protein
VSISRSSLRRSAPTAPARSSAPSGIEQRWSDRIGEKQDYAEAAQAYAAEHDLYYRRLYRIHSWFRDLWFGAGADAEALRVRALPRIAEDPSRIADFTALGPDAPSDEPARRRMFGED